MIMQYMGSKNRISKYIIPFIRHYRKPGSWYVEPFVGGCNMIDKIRVKRIGADNNKYLIAFLKKIQSGHIFTPKISKDMHDEAKKNFDGLLNSMPDYLIGFIGFVGSYRGIFFSGYAGNATNNKNYIKAFYGSVKKQQKSIQGVKFIYSSYDKLDIPDGSVVYCDPPYKGVTIYKSNKEKFNHDRFWQWCRKTAKKNIVLVSEYQAPKDIECVLRIPHSCNLRNSNIQRTEKLFKLGGD